MTLPVGVPTDWVVHCTQAGNREPALEYLSRYLYRGVIAERNILANEDGQVTFRYTESKTGRTKTRTLPGKEFLWLLMQHVLPSGFRRVRDYGFLHHNAKAQLRLVQWVLRVSVTPKPPTQRPRFVCAHCGAPGTTADMRVIHARESALAHRAVSVLARRKKIRVSIHGRNPAIAGTHRACARYQPSDLINVDTRKTAIPAQTPCLRHRRSRMYFL